MAELSARPARWRRRSFRFLLILGTLVAVLSIPDTEPPPPQPSGKKAFLWNQDHRWRLLEARFLAARMQGCGQVRPEVAHRLSRLRKSIDLLAGTVLAPEDSLFSHLEEAVFSLGPLIAACPESLDAYRASVTRLRDDLKDQSRHWDMSDPGVRDLLYRLLYGSRAALEEAMLQAPAAQVPAVVRCADEPSRTPHANILGITIHSGDILVSRGGAPTSALISRGNDYPGNFSHVALVHVDSGGAVSIIESHIEMGVAVANVEEYLRDTKLRVMVLRLRSDLPPVLSDPLLPHRAAFSALVDARSRHIPYDFAMDFNDSTEYFCSEVVSAAYRRQGVRLWMGMSSISTRGVASWLAAFGVRHFDTQEPADLEYDPQLRVVAEWRDPSTLYKDHLDNAVIDAMLEEAEAGRELTYRWYLLPFVRVVKGYSIMLNMVGAVGPVPEGMNATAALKHREFSAMHEEAVAKVKARAEEFRKNSGYLPPYWELVHMARQVIIPE